MLYEHRLGVFNPYSLLNHDSCLEYLQIINNLSLVLQFPKIYRYYMSNFCFELTKTQFYLLRIKNFLDFKIC